MNCSRSQQKPFCTLGSVVPLGRLVIAFLLLLCGVPSVTVAQDTPPSSKLGVIQEGALADLLLVDGDPLANLQLLADPKKNLVVIMKDGNIFKNLTEPACQ